GGGRVGGRPAAAWEWIGHSAPRIDRPVVPPWHSDPAGTLGPFAAARSHLQAAEMVYATGPAMCHAHLRYPFTADHVCEMVRNVYSGRVQFHDGDAEVAPGVTVHKIGGHSPGPPCGRALTPPRPAGRASHRPHDLENFQPG